MVENRCPRCGWPIAELAAGSVHPVAQGRVTYRRCVCGSWVLQVNGAVVASTTGSVDGSTPPA
jgi:hypothetical protein